MSTQANLAKLQSVLKHGGPLRAAGVLWERFSKGYSTKFLSYSWPKRMHLIVNPKAPEKVHFLVPHLLSQHQFAGLDTIVEIAKEEISNGKRVHFLLHDFSGSLDHLGLSPEEKARVSLSDFSSRGDIELEVNPEDRFVATAWWTKGTLDGASPTIQPQNIEYLIQDYEPLFYDPSDAIEGRLRMLAQESYQKACHWSVNSEFLLDYLKENLSLPDEARFRVKSFEPKINNKLYFEDPQIKKERIIFVYARPEVARNRFDLCCEILSEANIPEGWRILGLGSLKKDVPLGSDRRITAMAKLAPEDYAKLLRQAPIGISLMESPHPSHPPLEHVACGGWVICNNFAQKDYSRLGSNFHSLPLDAKIMARKLEELIEKAQRQYGL